MYALVAVAGVVKLQGRENSEFYPRGISVLLHGSNDLHRAFCLLSFVVSFHNLTKGALTKEFNDIICGIVSLISRH